MKYCANCGKELADNAAFCSECGAAQQAASQQTYQQQYQEPVYQQTPQQQYQQPYQAPQQAPADGGSFGWAVLGFCFPLVGLILYLVWKNNKPFSAKKAGIGALVGFVLNLILTFIGGLA
ncbi:MAG: zinc ribbon domain-containing protein [Firmicutes bacterium]|nr:zinc ribbon domain-containing protein [Bacillota bacterium]